MSITPDLQGWEWSWLPTR